MRWVVFLVLILFYLTLNDAQILKRKKRVIGGSVTPEGVFPYMASLKINKYGDYQHFCGAVIITEKYLLSSAHCLIYQDQISNACYNGKYADFQHMKHQLKATVGSNYLDEKGVDYDIHSFMYHANFNFKNGENDICLLLTKRDMIFSESIYPIDFYAEEVPVGVNVVVPGWGLTSFPGDLSNKLRHVHLRTISNEECAKAWNTVYKSQMCTYQENRGVCTSDSGGPLLYQGFLVGLVSFGKPCAAGWPDVFTNVTHLLPWILANMRCMDGHKIDDLFQTS